jgi:hypothetical protein
MSLKSLLSDIFAPEPVDTFWTEEDRTAHRARITKPRLVAVRRAPSREDFAAWRDEPTTQFVMAALARNAEECRDEWMATSWKGGIADQRQLDALRERSDALLGFTADYDAFCETLNLTPDEEAA